MPDPVAVNSMFGRIARRYDAANRLLSGGIDRWWRRRLVATVRRTAPRDVLDLATGSGDVAFALARGLPKSTRIIGMDFCRPMLDEAERKKSGAGGRCAHVEFREGDGLALPLPDASFDAVTISFGLRNMADRHLALREMHRVLRPGGHVFVLEFSQPHAFFRPIYYSYLRHVLPRLAAAVTGDKGAYDYLAGSIGSFPTHQAVADELHRAGFSEISVSRLTAGTVALHMGRKTA
jgi:demethylmenaquinone methyltransferase / 2-methoxy-6-polyprenyl-1,4-benzoquinol methylase